MTKKEMIEELEKGKPGFTDDQNRMEYDHRIMMKHSKWFIQDLYISAKWGVITRDKALARLLTR